LKASIKLITSHKETLNGFPIYVELFFSSKKRPRKIIGYSPVNFWNHTLQEPFKEHPEYNNLIGVILENRSKIQKVNYGQLNKGYWR